MADTDQQGGCGDTHQQMTSHLRDSVCLGSGSRVWSGMGAPCGERIIARSPRPAIYAPAPPITLVPPPTRTPNKHVHTYTLPATPGSLGAAGTPRPLQDFCGLARSQARPAATPHLSPSPSWKQERSRHWKMPHRERGGADRGLPGLRTWGEVWMGRPGGP